MRTLFRASAANPALVPKSPLFSGLLKGMATALVAATIFTVQPTTQANAQWYCWSWFCTPSAHAQSPTDISCATPPTLLTICVPTQIVKLIALAIGTLTVNEAAKQLSIVHASTITIEEAEARVAAGTKYPPKPRAGCSCECTVQAKSEKFPGPQRIGWAWAIGGDKGYEGCKAVFRTACHNAKTSLANAGRKWLSDRNLPEMNASIGDAHHERGTYLSP